MIVTKDQVKEFWENNPLFRGEIELDPMSRAFFEQHGETYRRDVLAGEFSDAFFPFPPNATVLDVGCGPGIWTREAARRGYRTTAVDLTDTAVVLARRSLELFDLKADIRTGDAENLPFADASFDGVISHGVVHHTPDTQKCIVEIARVLKPGGTAVVSVYYRNFVLRSRFLTWLVGLTLGTWVSLPGRGREGMLASGNPDEIVRLYDGSGNPLGKAYTAEQFERMFKDAGLKMRGGFRYYFPTRAFGRLGKVFSPIQRMLAARFGLMYTVIASKES